MLKKRNIFSVFCVMVMVFGLISVSGWAKDAPVADAKISTDGISWIPRGEFSQLILSVSCPDGTVFTKTFKNGSSYNFSLSELKGSAFTDGVYSYELREIAVKKNDGRKEFNPADVRPTKSRLMSGGFSVLNCAIVDPGKKETPDSPQDVLHYDDVIITGSICVGFDCINGESFGYCTQKFKENNLQVCFEDTSIGSFPTNDWKFQINDTTSGGASYFTLWDTDGGRRPFTVEAGAPAHSLYVEDYGRIGLGTSIPYVELHIKDGDSPTIRLDQDGSSGWTAQSWDLCGNETNFFIRDVTNGSKLCFRIQPNTPSNTLCMKANGYVGLGTWSPEYPLELETTGENATFKIERTSGAAGTMLAASTAVKFGSVTNHYLEILASNGWRARFHPNNSLEMRNGAELTAAGVWTDASSIELKENIENLSSDEAVETLQELKPVKYNYKVDKDEQYVGFIAEHVPELVATKTRKGMAPMDVVAVLTKVLQEQQKTVREHQKTILKLNQRIQQLEETVKDK